MKCLLTAITLLWFGCTPKSVEVPASGSEIYLLQQKISQLQSRVDSLESLIKSNPSFVRLKKASTKKEKRRAVAAQQTLASGPAGSSGYNWQPASTAPVPVYKKKKADEVYAVRTGAVCRDGTTSSATGRGACSHHGGVSEWLY